MKGGGGAASTTNPNILLPGTVFERKATTVNASYKALESNISRGSSNHPRQITHPIDGLSKQPVKVSPTGCLAGTTIQ